MPRIDVDEIGRELTGDGEPLLEVIRERFGCVIEKTPEGETGPQAGAKPVLSLDRKALAELIFGDSRKLEEYNGIIHGKMIEIIDERIAGFREIEEMTKSPCTEGFRAVLLDAPLLFEAGIENRCDRVILITAGEDIRVRRVAARDGAREEDVRARIASQMSDDEKAARSDFVVDNSGSSGERYLRLD